MDLKLNKRIVLLFILAVTSLLGQEDNVRTNEKEYKDGDQFERFYRRRRLIGSWQINQLHEGALVVKLKANNLLVNALTRRGDLIGAEEARIEAAGINVNLVKAYKNHYTFSKVYFIYSNMADSLLKGARENIFLDTNLKVDPTIKMTEKFYLLAENDRLYNSTIGFVPEDSARFVVEKGAPTTEEPFIVLKNKFGHQLKKPFPYFCKLKAGLEKIPEVTNIFVDGVSIPFNVVVLVKKNNAMSFKNENGERMEVFIPKNLTYERLTFTIQILNDNFYSYHRGNPTPRHIDPVLLPFLY